MHMKMIETDPIRNVTYGVKTVLELKRSTKVQKSSSEAVTRKKAMVYDYFLRQVDPIISGCITHLLCSQPENVIDSLTHYLINFNNSGLSEIVVNSTTKISQKMYLATKISPVISVLVNKIARNRPSSVVDYMLAELELMRTKDMVIVTKAAALLTTSSNRVRRPTSALPRSSPNGKSIQNQQITSISEATSRPVSAPANAINLDSLEPKKIQIGLLGLGGSGKTSFVNAIQGDYDSKVRPTIGFRPINMMLGNDLKVCFYDLGGGKKIRDIWDQYYHDIHAFMYLVDASSSDSELEESAVIFQSIIKNPFLIGKPVMIIANKQDNPNAKTAIEIADALHIKLNESMQVFECSCVINKDIIDTGISVEDLADPRIESTLEWIINVVKENFNLIDNRVKEDIKKKTGDEAKKRLARERRVLKNKIACAFPSLIDPSLLPKDTPSNPEDVFTEEEGITFLAAEIGEDLCNLSPCALEVAALIGYQRLALQMVGALKSPVSKKKAPLSWEEIRDIVLELRQELGLEA